MRLIVECQQCKSRFRLDEARIPASGAKVRCSHCKTAFVVKRPGATPDDVVGEVIAEATNPGQSSAPAPTEDLFERTHSPNPIAQDAHASGEDHWEFDEAPEAPRARREPAADERSPQRPSAPRSSAAEVDEDLDSLGSPAEWDLLTGAAERIAKEASFQTAPTPAAPRATPARKPERAAPVFVGSAPAASQASHEPEASEPAWRETLAEGVQTTVRGVAWLAASAACAAGLALALAPVGLPAASAPKPAYAAPEGVRNLTVRTLESAVAGRITLVRGELGSGPARTRVRVGWVEESGRVLAATLAGPPLRASELRELGVARIRAEHEQRGEALARGGEFEAVYAELPEGAVGIAVTRERVPEPFAPAAPPTSSDPSALPSSE
ncbi:MAG: zinc-ribbon domain-containing protein [Deltaproteobacteria bacterium]|nr:zinc-ribbon domain-containing protein [Deltaproteobacteria bacterium]